MDRFRPSSSSDAREFVDLYFGKNVPLKRLFAIGVSRQLNDPFIKAFMAELTEADFLNAQQLQRLEMPCLFLWGKRDQIMLPEQLEFFKQNLPPHVQIEEPVGYGHAPYIEHPYDLSARLMTFVNQNLAAAA
jgi:pimeloyl-ACP methyl ester carboxylesterase